MRPTTAPTSHVSLAVAIADLQQWLDNADDAAQVKSDLLKHADELGIARVYAGSDEVRSLGFGDPSTNPRTPNVVVVSKVRGSPRVGG